MKGSQSKTASGYSLLKQQDNDTRSLGSSSRIMGVPFFGNNEDQDIGDDSEEGSINEILQEDPMSVLEEKIKLFMAGRERE